MPEGRDWVVDRSEDAEKKLVKAMADTIMGGIAPFTDYIRRLKSERDAWERTAMETFRNLDYYRGLVVKIGEMFGEAAKTQDDGGKVPNVLCAKVPELVEAALKELNTLRARGYSL